MYVFIKLDTVILNYFDVEWKKILSNVISILRKQKKKEILFGDINID